MSATIAVIGAGHNGLTAAALLAKAGRKVVVLEARPVIGGLASREEFHDGFSGAGVLHHTSAVRRRLVESLDLGRFGLGFRSAPDVWVPLSGQDPGLWLRGDRVEGDIAGGDRDRYTSLRGFITRMSRVIIPLMEAPAPDPTGKLWPLLMLGLDVRRLGARDMTELLRVTPMAAADWMRDCFESERLGAALAMTALEGTFGGPSSPHSATALLLRACLSQGNAEVAGGPAALVAALDRAARHHGATIRTDALVASVVLSRDASTVTGVRLASGEVIDADIVVASCDPRTAFLELIGAQHVSTRLAGDIARIRGRGITAKMHLAIQGALETSDGQAVEALYTGQTLHDIERAFDPVKYGELASRPVLDVRVPSMADPGLCPDGHHVVSILAYFAPYHLHGGWSQARRDELGQSIIAALAAHFPNLPERIVGQEMLTPGDIEARYHVAGGHLHHGEIAPDQLLFLRPTIQCARSVAARCSSSSRMRGSSAWPSSPT